MIKGKKQLKTAEQKPTKKRDHTMPVVPFRHQSVDPRLLQ